MKKPSILGGACIIAGVCVGAGMLGLPAAGAGAWTLWTGFALCLTMIVMSVSGFLLLETFQHYDKHVSFDTVTRSLLGPIYNFINNLSVYFVGGILLYAYSTSLGDIVGNMFGLPMSVASILSVLAFSFPVWLSTRSVDRFSVLLIVFMIVSFVASISGLLNNISSDVLFNVDDQHASYLPYLMMLFPVALTSFGYHHSVASLRIYYQDEKKAQYAILGGTLIALVLYLVWVVSIFGNLPRQEFPAIMAKGGEVSALLSALQGVIDTEFVPKMINAFSIAAIVSSFVAVGLGVFDYLADLFHIKSETPSQRTRVWAVTFLPPLLCSVFFPMGFLKAIAYAGAVAAIWTCLTPPLLAWRARSRYGKGHYSVPAGYLFMILVFVFGAAVMIFHMLNLWGYLPVFK
ncbi:aromatic amino acid transport family protein [Basilea psittacipulmonis]|uniref:Aromatic amino acid permease n=1 Tax=Basilea psittacipulmonis DSM 24701 TaxID=1072685 RepID=A0A077DBD2_9BURK|nr:aromatic amino acid transport family protein [Basilea psittacipulmonis]AIL31979.1 TnaB [Basilea psittacipulmonis DSM 24701]